MKIKQTNSTKRTSSIVILAGLAFGVFAVSAQEKPDYGTIADIKSMTKVYVSAPSTEDRKMILSELKKSPSLVSVNSPDEAEFFLDYRIVSESRFHVVIPGSSGRSVTVELAAYTLKDNRKRIAWSETKAELPKGHIAQDFVKALKKAQASP